MKKGFRIISYAEKFLFSISTLCKQLRSRITTFRDDFIMTKIYSRGFTLIELLVVVLIIGILSAVALPQYEKAVNRTRLTKYKAFARRIMEAEKEYYLAHGRYTGDVRDLGVDYESYLSNISVTDGFLQNTKAADLSFNLWTYGGSEVRLHIGMPIKTNNDMVGGIGFWLKKDRPQFQNTLFCSEYATHGQAGFCKTFINVNTTPILAGDFGFRFYEFK